jgi:hypothetical protein
LAAQGFIVAGSSGNGVVERATRFGGDSIRFTLRAQEAEGNKVTGDNLIEVPDFRQMQMARAIKFGTASNVRVRLIGDGKVEKQFSEAGTKIDVKNPIVTFIGYEQKTVLPLFFNKEYRGEVKV